MRSFSSLCCLTLLAVITLEAGAQVPVVPPEKEALSGNAARAADFAAAEALRYEIRPADKGKRTFQLLPQPVLRWSNPTGGEVHGSVFLWTNDGCPELAASAYQFFDREQLNIELVSLSERSLKANRNGRLRWSPEAGLSFKAVPGGPEPAATAEKRQFQMRSLARRFTGNMTDPRDEARTTELRLLARPLHQYEATDGSGREGAVFALVSTTDPEILLLIESRKGKDGHEWVWAAARMHFGGLRLKLADKVVWEVPPAAPPWDKIRGPQGQYVILEWPTASAAAKD